MGLILDSDVIIDHLNSKSDYLSSIISLSAEDLFISVITWSEIVYGIRRSNNSVKAIKYFTEFLIDLSIKTLEFDQQIAKNFVSLKIALEKKGSRIGDFDLIIGSTAIVHDLVLVTKNYKHFSRLADIRLYSNSKSSL